MTQEEKQLLLQDLCARLPYGVKLSVIQYDDNDGSKYCSDCKILGIRKNQLVEFIRTKDNKEVGRSDWHDVSLFKPYLRPLSSLTTEERAELNERYGIVDIDEEVIDFGEFPSKNTPMSFPKLMSLYKWFNENHIDIYGLIPQGLALAAPEGMYD